MTKPTELGHLKNMTLKIDAPTKMEIDHMEFNSLTLMVGANGTGKSLILKLSWVFSTIMGIIVAKKGLPAATSAKMSIEGLSQYTFDKSFDDQNFNGTIGADYENGSITINMENGKIISVNADLAPEVETSTPAMFMSTDMRTFDQIKTFLKISKKLSTQDEITEFYKLYDVAYVKFLEMKIKPGWIATEKFKDILKQFDLDKLELESIEMDDNTLYYTNAKGQQIDLTTLSKGEQSMINMFLANM